MDEKTKQAISRIQELQLAFSQKLTERIDELQGTIEELDNDLSCSEKSNAIIVKKTHDLAHKLAGSAGTFQFTGVYDSAKKLEDFCGVVLKESFPCSDSWYSCIHALQEDVRLASEKPAIKVSPKTIFMPEQSKPNCSEDKAFKQIILVDDDELLSSLIQEQVKHFGYQITCINDPEELSTFLENETPEVILMDIVFPLHDYTGVDLVKQLKAADKINCPVVFLSNKGGFEERLEAIRAGGDGYLVKPVNILELIEVLDRYSNQVTNEAYYALIIDDDVIITEYYKEALSPYNFKCKAISDPFNLMEILRTFSPDIILLDVNMPSCNGFEVTEVIRQNNQFAHIPILFLTADNNNDCEMKALKAGGDYFLSKETNLDVFITHVISHSQRSKELHQVIERLRKDEVRFQAVSHSTSDAIITLNAEKRIIFWNEGSENLFGYQSIEAVGQSIDLIISQQCQQSTELFLKEPHNNQNKYSIECEAMNKDRQVVFIELTLTEWLSGNELYYTTIIRDIGQRKETEKNLETQQKYIEAIVNHSAEGIITINQQGVIEMINPSAVEMFGYDDKVQLTGKKIALLMKEEMREQHGIYLKNSTLDKSINFNKLQDIYGLRKNGESFPIELSMSPMSIDGNKKYVGIIRDITETKQAIDAIVSAKLEAENANQAKSLFLSNMSHELRTPLNAIIGFTELLLDDTIEPLSEDHSDSMTHVNVAGHHLLKLIDEVLDLSKIEAGKIELKLEKINLIQLINQAITLLTPQALKAQVNFESNLPDEEIVFIEADEFRFNQVLAKLFSNAIKYNSSEGYIFMWLTQNEKKVRLSIKDTGRGIPDKMMDDLFKPFNRLGAEKSDVEGTGIGLTITKVLVEMMGGTIGVNNTYGDGCTFWLEFELHQSSGVINTSATWNVDPNHIKQKGQPLHILYIEDNFTNRLLMKKIISRHIGFQYSEAFTGGEGVQAALETQPQIILLDINLPDFDGFEVYRQLQANDLTKNIPVIVVSANAMPEDIAKGKQLGVFGYITKPINQTQLFASIHKALNQGIGVGF